MSQQVGFNLQGDVFLGSSLVISAAGRLLKLLSDAGVDTYAVAAALELGKQVPISLHQETVVSAAMHKRRCSRAGYLVQALRIGWGCYDTAYELSRTGEATAALMLADAFSAGRSYYLAAQALQELISLSGCRGDLLPSVTVLKGLVSHVAPIMEDSGFQTTLEHIRATSIIALRRLYPLAEAESNLSPISSDHGSPRDWAGSVKQLILVASRGETAYIKTDTRGAWLAAFAVHLLSMECTLLHGSKVLWHAAGSQGSVTIQLAMHHAPPVQKFWCSLLLKLDPLSGPRETLETFYVLKDALQTELSLLLHLTEDFRNLIREKIVQIVQRFAKIVHITSNIGMGGPKALINDETFGHHYLVISTVQELGIEFHTSNIETISNNVVTDNIDIPRAVVKNCPCDVHRSGVTDGACQYLEGLKRLIRGAAATAFALLLCEANASQSRVSAKVFNGTESTTLSDRLFYLLGPRVDPSRSFVTLSMLLGHLRHLVHGEATSKTEIPHYCLGVSARSTTIAFKALLDEEVFTDDGKFLAIYSGRLTADGEFREYVSNKPSEEDIHRDPILECWSIPEGTTFSPASAEGLVDLRCSFELREDAFRISCNLFRHSTDVTLSTMGTRQPLPLTCFMIEWSIIALLQTPLGRRCRHAKDKPFVIPASDGSYELRAAHFCARRLKDHWSCPTYTLVGTQGNKLTQLFALEQDFYARIMFFRQGACCLACAFDQARSIFQRECGHWERVVILCD